MLFNIQNSTCLLIVFQYYRFVRWISLSLFVVSCNNSPSFVIVSFEVVAMLGPELLSHCCEKLKSASKINIGP